MTSLPPETRPISLRAQLVMFTAVRLAINTGHRMIYPFLPFFADGLNISLSTAAHAVAARSSLGLISPLFGILADRRGRKAAMLLGLLLFTGGMLLVSCWPTYPALFAALLAASACKLLFDPAMMAYIGDRVPYARRGAAIALTELSWSGAFLFVIPVLGWLIARADVWYAPFPLLAGAGGTALLALWRIMPSDRDHAAARPSFARSVRGIFAHPAALAALGMGFLLMFGNELIGVIYGAWLEESFGLQVTALGASAIVIGIAEMTSESGVAAFVDRVGKRRAVAAGLVGNALANLLLPLLGTSTAGALVALFFVYLTFEFAVVSALPLMTELVPDARATLLAGSVTLYSAGRTLGALIGPWLFDFGLPASALAAALCDVAALALVLLFVHHE